MSPNPEIVAAGAVVSRKGPEVLLVHRPKYDDWSFPKGKVDPGEHVVATAVREVAEETGLDVRLGPPLSPQTYLVADTTRPKRVYYWAGRVVGGDDVALYRPNDEIDQVAWVGLDKARRRLTYAYDLDTLDEFTELRRKSYPLIVLRHSRARSRRSWRGDDRKRTLTKAGEFQSEQVVPLLAAYGESVLQHRLLLELTSRVTPYADVADLDIEVTTMLTEEDGTEESVDLQVQRLLALDEPTVLCTHRPLLPWVWDALGVERRALDPGAMVVAHHRRSRVLTVEQHEVAFR